VFLKTVELTGFKSFPSKTSIHFEKGITAIVGPNGSGKSNISDAIRWVFGEMSSKILRGAKMEDVIFGGTKEIKPSSFARVSLIIDNSDKLVDCDYSEIKITRQLARSGESGYFINDKGVRLKDIYELFLNTGVGREGYSIIGQGRIAELISKKSEDRRSIFEEASGISKYRYRKSEAEKKLVDVRDNLTRIKDIIFEIEGRVEPLRIESEKAKKYLDLYDRKKALEIYVWVNSIEKMKSEFEKIISDYEISKFNYENADAQYKRLNEKSDNLYDKLLELNASIEKKREEYSQAQISIVGKNADIDIIKNNIAKIEAEIELSLSEFEKNKIEIENINKEITDKNEAIDKINSEYKELEMEIEDVESYAEHIDLKLSEQNNKTDELNSIISNLTDEINGLKIKISEKNAEIKHILEREGILKSDIEKIFDIKEKNKKDLANLNSRKKSAERDRLKTETELQETDETIKELQKSEKLKRKEYDALYLEHEKNEKFIQSLTYIYENLEGYPESVKSVVKSGLKGVNGTVAQLIGVEDEYAAAIETALSQNLQNIIVDDENSAKEAIKYLKNNNLGRATFYPVSIIKGRFIERDRIDFLRVNGKSWGFVDIASNLVKCDSRYENIIKYLLGRTIICENINHAGRIAEKTAYQFKIVTLDGQVINAGGSFTGGSTVKKSSLLSNKNEIENLKKKNIEHEERQNAIQKEIDGIIAGISKLSERDRILKGELNAHISELYKIDSEIKLKLSAMEVNDNQTKSAETELKENEARIAAQKQNDYEKQLAGLVKKSGEYANLLNQYKNGAKRIIEEKDAVLSQISQKKMALLNIQGIINIENERLENLNRNKINLKSQNEKISSQNGEKKSNLTSAGNDIVTVRNEIKELENKAGEIEVSLKELESGRNGLEKENAETKNNIREKGRDRDIVMMETSKLESMKNEKQKEHDNIINRLWEEYNLSFSEAKETSGKYIDVINEIGKAGNIPRELSKIKSAVKELGNVNVNAIEEYKELNARYRFMMGQSADLGGSLEYLQKIIEDLEIEMKTVFSESMQKINENFKEVFSELFGGGTAGIIYTDPNNVLESELEIEVQPPGKNVKHISLLSGGEQAFVAIALYFALLKMNPAPFCVLDEIESALDEVNVDRFAAYLKRYAEQTQFIIISHRRGTMEIANRLYGITMQEKGISKYLALDINEAEKRIGTNAVRV